jgi:hypothetical protein
MEPVTVHIINTSKSEAQAALKSTHGLVLNSGARVIIVVAAGPRLDARRLAEQKRTRRSTSAFWPQLEFLSSAFCT